MTASRENTDKLQSPNLFKSEPIISSRFGLQRLILLRRFILKAILAPLLISVFLWAGCKSTHQKVFEPGSSAPDFTILEASGSSTSLSSLKGKVVLVVLWATWCSTCKSQIASLSALQEKFGAGGFAIIAPVINDSKDAYRNFLAAHPMPFITGTSHDDIGALYKVTGVPESFVLDKAGKFVLMQDPASGGATVRFTGPRSWESPAFTTQFKRILRE